VTVNAFPLDPGSEARTILHHLLQHGNIAGRDAAGRTVIALAVDDWLLERLLTFDAGTEDLEDGDGEPDDDAETDGPACWNPATTRWRNDQEAYNRNVIRSLLALTLLVTAAAAAQPVLVIDGDTLDLAGERIRLWGIDAPEGSQIFQRDGRDWQCGDDEGGIAGERAPAARYADPGIFEDAPRYHGGGFAGAGLLPDEVPIIARRGELVVPGERVVREEKSARADLV
jgi:hypothetical protein